MGTRLLATKLRIPPRPGELIPRERLFDRLDQSLQRKLTMISAPAGFGKTTLVADWAAARLHEGRFAAGWLALDTGDNDLVRFLNYLAAALDAAVPALRERIDPLLKSPHPPPANEILTAMINHLVAAGEEATPPCPPVVLILDDYHLVTVANIHDAVAFLLEHQPAGLHLILLTRADPPLPLPRLRSQGQLLELRQGDLRFTEGEAARFLQQVMRLPIGKTEVATLASRTEGWVAGLQMAALALRGRHEDEAAAFVASFSGTHRYVLDYLLEEVLQRQPEKVQNFLMQTSILERLCAPLCDALLGGEPEPATRRRAQEILDYLDANNLFLVQLDEQRGWYRYHRLFADLLQLRLEQSMPALLPTLHERAATWLEMQGETGAAVSHLLAAGATGRAAVLVDIAAESAVMHGEIMTLLNWVDALPEEEVSSRPHLALLYAWAMLLGGRPASQFEYWLAVVESDARADGWSNAIRAYVHLFEGDTPAARLQAGRALEILPPQAVFLRQLASLVQSIAARYQDDGRNPDQELDASSRASAAADNRLVAVLALCSQADLAFHRGNIASATAIYEHALALAQSRTGRLLPVASAALLGLATLALERGNLAEAASLLETGMALTRQWSGVESIAGHLLQARLHFLRGEQEAMWSMLDEAAGLARRFDVVATDDLLVALLRTQIELVTGRVAPALRWLESRGLQAGAAAVELADHPSPLRKYEYLLLARSLLAQQRPADALHLLAALQPYLDRLHAHVALHLLQAIAYDQMGERAPMLAALHEALALAEPAGLVAVFVEEGAPAARLLYRALEMDVAADYAGQLLAAFPPAGEEQALAAQRQLVERLSEREIEVLALVANGLTNQEIAARLYLSLATVKWHTSNIYGKLGAGNRVEAVTIARTLGLLPSR